MKKFIKGFDGFLKKFYNKESKTKLTRVEVIGRNGKIFGVSNQDFVELSFQDEGRTLKIFIK